MNKKLSIAVISGDRRQELLAQLLRKDGHETYIVHTYGDLDAVRIADLTVFPTPACREDGTVTDVRIPASEIFLHMHSGSMAAGGRIPEQLYHVAGLRNVQIFDYTKRDDFAIANAVATAEGAIGIAAMTTDITIQGSRCLVIGNGRIGKLLAAKLRLLGADVTVSARSVNDITWIKAAGHTAVHTGELLPAIGQFDIIFNTVPAMVLGREELKRTASSVFVVDLASKPGGVDFDAAQDLGIRVDWALSLPAKTAPYSAASYVRDSLYNIMEESNDY